MKIKELITLSMWAAFLSRTTYGHVLVANFGSGTIGEYSTSGVTINSSLISGLGEPNGIAISGNDLFVANSSGVTPTTAVGEYTLSGNTVNASLNMKISFTHL